MRPKTFLTVPDFYIGGQLAFAVDFSKSTITSIAGWTFAMTLKTSQADVKPAAQVKVTVASDDTSLKVALVIPATVTKKLLPGKFYCEVASYDTAGVLSVWTKPGAQNNAYQALI